MRTLGRVRREQPALVHGRYQELLLTNRQYAFARLLDEQGVIVAVNNDGQEAGLSIRLPVRGESCTDLVRGEVVPTENGCLRLTLAPNESRLIAVK